MNIAVDITVCVASHAVGLFNVMSLLSLVDYLLIMEHNGFHCNMADETIETEYKQ